MHIKPGTFVKDNILGITGMITHIHFLPGAKHYLLQPPGLNKEEGKPFKGIWCVPAQLQAEETESDADIPLDALGSKAEDIATGFNGIICGIFMHVSGCLHIDIQPLGSSPKTGEKFESRDFDIRRCKGEKIPVLSEQQLTQQTKEKPSPAGIDATPLSRSF